MAKARPGVGAPARRGGASAGRRGASTGHWGAPARRRGAPVRGRAAPARGPAAALLVVLALLAAGCGTSASALLGQGRHHPPSRSAREKLPPLGAGPVPAPAPTGRAPDPAAVKVIVAWSSALGRGDVRAAAAYFALPSELLNGQLLFTIHTRIQAQAANETLSCGARFLSADQRGRYVNALFKLTGRPGPGGSDCGPGAGQTARTNFIVTGGHILAWIRAPSDPGDNGNPAAPATGAPNPLV